MTYFQYHNLIILFSPSITSVVFLTNFCDGLKYFCLMYFTICQVLKIAIQILTWVQATSPQNEFFSYMCVYVCCLFVGIQTQDTQLVSVVHPSVTAQHHPTPHWLILLLCLFSLFTLKMFNGSFFNWIWTGVHSVYKVQCTDCSSLYG